MKDSISVAVEEVNGGRAGFVQEVVNGGCIADGQDGCG